MSFGHARKLLSLLYRKSLPYSFLDRKPIRNPGCQGREEEDRNGSIMRLCRRFFTREAFWRNRRFSCRFRQKCLGYVYQSTFPHSEFHKNNNKVTKCYLRLKSQNFPRKKSRFIGEKWLHYLAKYDMLGKRLIRQSVTVSVKPGINKSGIIRRRGIRRIGYSSGGGPIKKLAHVCVRIYGRI